MLFSFMVPHPMWIENLRMKTNCHKTESSSLLAFILCQHDRHQHRNQDAWSCTHGREMAVGAHVIMAGLLSTTPPPCLIIFNAVTNKNVSRECKFMHNHSLWPPRIVQQSAPPLRVMTECAENSRYTFWENLYAYAQKIHEDRTKILRVVYNVLGPSVC